MKLASIFNQTGFNSYSSEGHDRKVHFHKEGPRLLKTIAADLGITDFDVGSNKGGMAVSGEVTLHSDVLYLQLFESSVGASGIRLLYRNCKGKQDFTGGRNHEVMVNSLSNSNLYARLIAECKRLLPLTA